MLDFGTFAFIAKYRASHGPSLPTAEGGGVLRKDSGMVEGKGCGEAMCPVHEERGISTLIM